MTSAPTSPEKRHSLSTKAWLVEVARELFTTQGYANTSLDAVVSGAQVTKGALYHHFSGKQALYEAVFTEVEKKVSRQITEALADAADPWEKALVGLRTFLTAVQDPTYQRVVIQEGPAILGYERFREQEERTSYGIIQEIVSSVLLSGDWELDKDMQDTFSRVFFGALSAAGEMVANATDGSAAVTRVEVAITFILAGLRALAETNVPLPDLPES